MAMVMSLLLLSLMLISVRALLAEGRPRPLARRVS